MKILCVSYHNPNFVNTTVYRERAIKELGHDLVSFDDRSFLISGRVRQAVGFLQKWDLERLNEKLIRLVDRRKPDLCLVVGGYNILKETVLKLKKRGVVTSLWTTDVPINFENIIKTAPFYDHVFCAGTEAVALLKSSGVREATWVPYGCDPEYHRPVDLTGEEKKKYGRDISFVGSFYPNRARVLESISDLDLAVWGPYWSRLDKASPITSKAVSAKLNYDEWIKIYSASKINLVIHYDDGKTPCNQASPKLYETLACKAFALVDDQHDARVLFEDGRHLVFFTDENDLKKKIRYYLDHPDERDKIAEAGYREVLDKHTYRHRISRILSVIETKR